MDSLRDRLGRLARGDSAESDPQTQPGMTVDGDAVDHGESSSAAEDDLPAHLPAQTHIPDVARDFRPWMVDRPDVQPIVRQRGYG
jgi:hypothetical protein